MAPRPWCAIGTSVFAFVALGCGPAETHWSSEQTWSSRHFVYHARPDDTSVGAEVLDYLEENAELVGHAELGVDPTTWGPVQYFKYRDADDFSASAPCPTDHGKVDACAVQVTDGRIEIHTAAAVDSHELVHAYAFSIGSPRALLIEGLAVALSCDPGIEEIEPDTKDDRAVLTRSWTDFLDYQTPDGSYDYVVRGMFITWLLDHYGSEPLRAVYRETSDSSSVAEMEASFQTHFHASLDDLWQSMVTAPTRRTCVSLAACTVLDASSSALARPYPAVPIPASGLLVAAPGSTSSDESPAIRVCAPSSATALDVVWPTRIPVPGETAVFFPADDKNVLTSKSDLTFGWDHGPVPPPDFTATPLAPSSLGVGCAGVTPIRVADESVKIRIWPRRAPAVFELQSGSGSGLYSFSAYADGNDAPFTIQVCSGCQEGALVDCETIRELSGWAWSSPIADAWFQVQWGPNINVPLTLIALF